MYAKVRGFPYWPAKALRCVGSELDVRFFGAHDRSMVPIDRCYWLSKELPSTFKNHQSNMNRSCAELDLHIKKLKKEFGAFQYGEPLSTIDIQKPHVYLAKFTSKQKAFFRSRLSGNKVK